MKTIFVSSTFRDMHYERDIIHDRVTPTLNAVARQYGESVAFCDLRWGVNTGELESEDGSRKVLSVCLQEIDRCRPYMLVILGDRYGWIPDQGLIADAASRARFALEELEQSVTALEIEYGALSNPEQLERTLFYFREFAEEPPAPYRSEDPHHAAKLQTLKERIRKLAGNRLSTYTLGWDPEANRPVGLELFAALVESDVRGLMEREWKETATLTPYQRDQRGQWDYAAQKARQFSARENFVSDCIAMLDGGTHLLALQGESGTGKSTLMARLSQVLQERGDGVLPIFCATTPLCNNSLDLVRYIVHDLEDRLDLPHFGSQSRNGQPPEQEWTDRLEDLVAAYNSRGEGRLMILIDGVDQLFADEGRDKLRFVPYNLSSKVQMVLSCLEDFPLSRPMAVQVVEPLAAEDRSEIIRGILSFLGRELDKPVIDAMVQKPAAHSPLYLSLVVQRLTMMNKEDFDEIAIHGDGMAAITWHQLELVEGCSDTLEGMCVDILSAASRRVGGPFVQAAAEYLAASRHGLRESDLEGLLTARGISWSGLDFAQFVQYLSTFFLLREDGRYDFAHQSIRRGVLAQCRDVQQLHRDILAHLLTLDAQDEVRMREFGYHCILADDKQAFVDYVRAFEEDETVVSFAARDAHDLAMDDGGQWLQELFRQGIGLGAGHAFITFLTFELNAAFGVSQAELERKLAVLEAGLALARQVNHRDQTAESRRDLAVSYDKVGDVYQAVGGRANLERALELYQQGLQLSVSLDRERNFPGSRRDLAVSYYKLGSIYEALGGQENLMRALELYQKDLELTEACVQEAATDQDRQSLAKSYGRMGGIYEALKGRENLMRALECYQKGLDLQTALAKVLDTPEIRRALAVSYLDVGNVYEALGGRENLEHALANYDKALELFKTLVREQGSARSYRDLSVGYEQTAGVYEMLGEQEDLMHALELDQKALELREALARALGTAQSRRELSVSLERVGNIYTTLGGRENLEHALKLYLKSLELREILAQEQNTTESRRDLSFGYHKAGDVYEMLGGQENLNRALALHQKGLELRKTLTRALDTAQSRQDLAGSYDKVAGIYAALGGQEHLMRALALYEAGLELRETLARTLDTAESRRDLFSSYYMVGSICEALGGQESMERSLAYARKSWKLAEAMARDWKAIFAYDSLAISCHLLGTHPAEGTEARRNYLEQFLQLSEQLYRQTHSQRHQTMVSVARQLLEEAAK